MLYNIADLTLRIIFYLSTVSAFWFVIKKILGDTSETLNKSILKVIILSLVTFFLFSVGLPKHSEKPMVNLKRSGEIVMTDKGYVFENALGNLSFAIPNGKSTEWVSASYGNIIRLEETEEIYTYEVYGSFLRKYVIHVPSEDWDEVVSEFGNEIQYSVITKK